MKPSTKGSSRRRFMKQAVLGTGATAATLGAGTVGLTAGASAPEKLVREVVDRLSDWRAVEEDIVTAAEENMIFKLPRQLTE